MKGMKKTNPARWFLALALVGVAISGQSATFTWDGGGNDNNFWTWANWVGNVFNDKGTNQFIFSDASLRSQVVANVGQNRDTGPFVLGGDAFTFVLVEKSLRLNQGAAFGFAIQMDTASTITFSCHVTAYQGAGQMIVGTGTGRINFNGGFNVNNGNSGTFAGAGTYAMNRSTGISSGVSRTVTIGGACTVLANNTSGSGTGTGAVMVNSGATLGGTGFIALTNNNVTVASGGRLAPGDGGAESLQIDFLGTGRLVLQTGALFSFDLAAPAVSDEIVVTAGGVTLNGLQFGDFTFNTLPGFSSGTYTLIESVATTGSLGAVTTGTVGGKPAELKLVGNNLVLEVPATVILIR